MDSASSAQRVGNAVITAKIYQELNCQRTVANGEALFQIPMAYGTIREKIGNYSTVLWKTLGKFPKASRPKRQKENKSQKLTQNLIERKKYSVIKINRDILGSTQKWNLPFLELLPQQLKKRDRIYPGSIHSRVESPIITVPKTGENDEYTADSICPDYGK
ncbi:hypothetical protein QYM36_007673 [Artemia franciscana]|uniref:Uncharacterized protein n=1 Tax=Artemia franciscana TaxID=6661 RepID=A0AA88IEZ9_ARTSF|nr:hypothetical protein QYM36_007673 [Artemia franciscana]